MWPSEATHARVAQIRLGSTRSSAKQSSHQRVDADACTCGKVVLQVRGHLRRGACAGAHKAPFATQLLLRLEEIAAVGPQQSLGGGNHDGASGALRSGSAA